HPAPGSCSCPARHGDLRYGAWRVPRAGACDVEEARFYGDDLDGLDAIAIEAELVAATQVLATLRRGTHLGERDWLLDRRRRLLAAWDARSAATGPAEGTFPAKSGGCQTLHTRAVEVL